MGRGPGSGSGRPRKDDAVDPAQRTLVFSFGLSSTPRGIPTHQQHDNQRKSQSESVEHGTGGRSSKSGFSSCSSSVPEPVPIDLYSSLGPSASACASCSSTPSSQDPKLQKLLQRYEQLLRVEVADWLDGVLNKVVADVSGGKDLKKSYMRYEPKRKASVVRAYEAMQASNPKETTTESVKKMKVSLNDSTLSSKKVKRWLHHGPSRKAGRRYSEAFERQVLDELMFTTLEKVDNENKAVVIANVCFTHELIITAAKSVQARAEWADHPLVKTKKFRRTWIRGWLKRNALRPRRITAQTKELPSPAVVQATMKKIQDRIIKGDYDPDEVFNGDETGMLFGAPPKKQYVPESADRATSPEADDKSRFTSFLYASSDGSMGPTFNIIKSQSKNPYDLSGTTKIKSLHRDEFTEADGWKLKEWSRTMVLPNSKKEKVNVVCKRPYLIHDTRRDVITCQNKAWMDSAGVAMWCDLQFGPSAKAKRGKALMVWDNCGPHKVDAVRQVFQEWNVEVLELPPKMTDILQVMDLAVNGPLKAAIRRKRAKALFAFFQEWKIERLKAVATNAPSLPPFTPPKPRVEDGLKAVLHCVGCDLSTPKFKVSLQRSFEKVGLRRQEAQSSAADAASSDTNFVVYTAHKKAGWLLPTLMGEVSANEMRIIASEMDASADVVPLSAAEVITEFIVEPQDASRMEHDETPEEHDGSDDDLD